MISATITIEETHGEEEAQGPGKEEEQGQPRQAPELLMRSRVGVQPDARREVLSAAGQGRADPLDGATYAAVDVGVGPPAQVPAGRAGVE